MLYDMSFRQVPAFRHIIQNYASRLLMSCSNEGLDHFGFSIGNIHQDISQKKWLHHVLDSEIFHSGQLNYACLALCFMTFLSLDPSMFEKFIMHDQAKLMNHNSQCDSKYQIVKGEGF